MGYVTSSTCLCCRCLTASRSQVWLQESAEDQTGLCNWLLSSLRQSDLHAGVNTSVLLWRQRKISRLHLLWLCNREKSRIKKTTLFKHAESLIHEKKYNYHHHVWKLINAKKRNSPTKWNELQKQNPGGTKVKASWILFQRSKIQKNLFIIYLQSTSKLLETNCSGS